MKAVEGGVRLGDSLVEGPLHHASHGPPPRTGEDHDLKYAEVGVYGARLP